MTTDEIIRKLRFRAEGEQSAEETKTLLNEAADKLEELDERVAIMSEGKVGHWREYGECSVCGWYWSQITYDVGENMLHMNYCPYCGARMEEEDDNTNA